MSELIDFFNQSGIVQLAELFGVIFIAAFVIVFVTALYMIHRILNDINDKK